MRGIGLQAAHVAATAVSFPGQLTELSHWAEGDTVCELGVECSSEWGVEEELRHPISSILELGRSLRMKALFWVF